MSNISKIKVGETTYGLKDLNAMTYADNGALGAKNLLPNNATSQTINGVTFTVNEDGSVTANGTATANIYWEYDHFMLQKGSYILTSAVNGSFDTTGLYIQKNSVTIGIDQGSGVKVDLSETATMRVVITVKANYTVDNLVYYPMLRLASDPDDTYVPYAMTNRELTEEKLSISELKTIASSAADFAAFKTAIANL